MNEEIKGMTLVKTDRNGSKHYEGMVKCDKCGGVGLVAHHVENGLPSWNWTDGGVCWKCGGTGKIHGKVIIRTPEYQAKLDAKRKEREEKKEAEHEAKIEQIRKDWLIRNGWTEDGFIYLFLGNTYEVKDQIKELGGRFNRIVGWYIDHEVEGFEFLKISKDLILDEVYWGYDWKYYVDVNALKKAEEARLHPAVHNSEYQGEIKERLKGLNLTLNFKTTFESSRQPLNLQDLQNTVVGTMTPNISIPSRTIQETFTHGQQAVLQGSKVKMKKETIPSHQFRSGTRF